MRIRFARLAALLAIACLAAFGAGSMGNGLPKFKAEKGLKTQTLTLKAAGEKLTRRRKAGNGGAVEISEGMLRGNDVMFKVVREFNGNKFEQNYKGSLSGDDLKLTMEVGGGRGKGSQELTFKRAQ